MSRKQNFCSLTRAKAFLPFSFPKPGEMGFFQASFFHHVMSVTALCCVCVDATKWTVSTGHVDKRLGRRAMLVMDMDEGILQSCDR